MQGRLIALTAALIVAGPSFAGTAQVEHIHRSGLHWVGPGSHQGQPVSMQEREAWQEALRLAAEHPDDFGYPWFSSGKLVMRAATPAGTQLASSMETGIAVQVHVATATYAELERIKDDVMLLRDEDVPGSSAIVAAQPDDENNRVIVTVTRDDGALLGVLASLYGEDKIAIRLIAAPGWEELSRDSDEAPFSGGSLFRTPTGGGCTLGIPWTTGFITAGHCIPNGGVSNDSIGRYLGFTVSGKQENWELGVGTVYLSDLSWRGGLAYIEILDPEYTVNPKIYIGGPYSSTTREVTDMWNVSPVVGDQYCTGGYVTGEICGWSVTATRVNVKYKNADTGITATAKNVTAGAHTTLQVLKGDSGGPVYTVRSDGTIAVKGITSGGTRDGAPPPYDHYFTDILLAVGQFPGTAKTTQVSILLWFPTRTA